MVETFFESFLPIRLRTTLETVLAFCETFLLFHETFLVFYQTFLKFYKRPFIVLQNIFRISQNSVSRNIFSTL